MKIFNSTDSLISFKGITGGYYMASPGRSTKSFSLANISQFLLRRLASIAEFITESNDERVRLANLDVHYTEYKEVVKEIESPVEETVVEEIVIDPEPTPEVKSEEISKPDSELPEVILIEIE